MLNKAMLQGRLTAAPELRATPNNVSVASFTIACDRDYGSGDEKKIDFIRCVAWRGTAEFISKYFDKGSQIVIDGRIETDSWTDKNGEKRNSFDILVANAYFAGPAKKQTTDTESSSSPPNEPKQETPPDRYRVPSFTELPADGELPF